MNEAQLKYTSLDYVEDLLKAGFDEKQSKAQAKALFRVIEQNAVTKQDLKELEVKIKELDVKLSYEMKVLESRLTVKLSTIMGGMLTLAITVIGFLIHFLR